MVDVRVVQHGFRRDTSDVQTSSSQSSALLNAGSLVVHILTLSVSLLASERDRE